MKEEFNLFVKKINEKKSKQQPLIKYLNELELLLDKFDDTDRFQFLAILCLEYYNEQDFDKSKIYSKKAVAELLRILKTKVMEKEDILFVVNYLEKCVLVEINIEEYETGIFKKQIFEEKSKNEYFKYFLNYGTEIFNFLILEFKNSKDFDFIFFMTDFLNENNINRLEIFFDLLYLHYNEDKIDFLIQKLGELFDKNKILRDPVLKTSVFHETLLINLVIIDQKNFHLYSEILRNMLIFRKNDLKDLSYILISLFKIEKTCFFKNIIDEFLKFKNLFTTVENNILNSLYTEFTKITNNSINLEILKQEYINSINILYFYFAKKEYEKVVSLYKKLSQFDKKKIPPNIIFKSLVKIKDFKSAEVILQEDINSKFKISEDSFSMEMSCEESDLSSENVFLYYILTNNNIGALNTIQKINDKNSFVKCLKKVYKYNVKQIIIAALGIGIQKFADDIEILMVYISYIHILEFEIQPEERSEIILKALKDTNLSEYSEKIREWFFTVLYNNVIDLLNTNNPMIFELLERCYEINSKNLGLIEITLYVFKQIKIKDKKEHIKQRIAILYEDFNKIIKLSKDQETDLIHEIFISFYHLILEFSLENQLLDLIPKLYPISKFSLENLKILLHTEISIPHNHTKIKISIINESYKRNILTVELFDKFIITSTFFGPISFYSFLSEVSLFIDIQEFISDFSKNIINTQSLLLKATGHYEIYEKLKNIYLGRNL
ncbi:hypothetical protein CWI37_0267p0020 [Hamiltosporidium tvaerminnensis]|uniref:Uncharacterized protein n=1 Tax=Hamiltosporidium tvaerminnensis TaxID=1176355 RepID=A0A4Q9L8C4_9MICR|nr:hypothetical protein CWI37_0267p0020 [Hamiltosporidium tvaerminnensis]